MYLREGRSLLLKVPKPPIPFILSTDPIPNFREQSEDDGNEKGTIPVKETEVLARLRCETDISLALDYFKDVARSCPFKHTSSTYSAVIERLADEGEIDAMHYLLQEMKLQGISCSEDAFVGVIKSCGRFGTAEQTLQTFYRIREFGCSPSVRIYNHLLDALLCGNRFHMIYSVYHNMRSDGLEPNVYTYNILLKGLCKNRSFRAALRLLEEMGSKGCDPDDVSYTTVMSFLCKNGQVKEASELILKFIPCLPAYNALINGFVQEGNLREALRLLDEMEEREVAPNVVTYTTISNCLSETGHIELALAILGKMFVKGCCPNTHTVTSLIRGLCLHGRWPEALEILIQMLKNGPSPNEVTYNTLIHGLCLVGKMDEALSIYEKMDVRGCLPNPTTYSALINGYAKSGNLDGASDIWNKMMSSGCRPNVVTYTSMVDVLCRSSMFRQAFDLVESMIRDKCPPNTVTLNVFIKGLCAKGRIDWAMEMFAEMEKHGCIPDVTTYNELLNGLFTANRSELASALVMEMEKRGIRFNLVTYNTLIHGLCMCGSDFRQAEKLLGRMILQGFMPDSITLNVLVEVYCKQGDIDSGTKVLESMRKAGVECDVVGYTNLICGLSKRNDFQAVAFRLDAMAVEGMIPNASLWSFLVRSLVCRIGYVEAVDQMDAVLACISCL